MSQPFCRERRSWTTKEDQLLREAVQREDPDNANPSKWHAIAKHVPNRTNKDCRKRWFAKMASDVVKGGWAPDEDEKLVKGIERYGTRWSLVASVVQTRNSDQCAKRWTDTLNPAIDRTTWTPEADEMLLRAVAEHGKVWTKIVKTYFPGRTGLSAKNRYNSITRFSSDPSRSIRPRRKSEGHPYLPSRKAESISSASSSGSPATPSLPLPLLSQSSFHAPLDGRTHPYLDVYQGWSSSNTSLATDESSLRASPISFEFISSNPAIHSGSMDGYQSFDISMNPPFSSYNESPLLLFSEHTPSMPTGNYKTNHYASHNVSTHYPHVEPSHGANECADRFPNFDASGPGLGIHWDNSMLLLGEPKPFSGPYRSHIPNSFALRS